MLLIDLSQYLKKQEDFISFQAAYIKWLEGWVFIGLGVYLLTVIFIYFYLFDTRRLPNLIKKLKSWLKRFF